jgi:hypothetical protein
MKEEEVMGSGEPRIRENQKPGVGRKSKRESFQKATVSMETELNGIPHSPPLTPSVASLGI